MATTFIIDGGLGRQIAAIPALEKFIRRYSDTNIITHFWTPIYWGNKILANRTFDASTKGLFDRVKDTKIVKPEPYYNSNYINNKVSLADAFNEEINGDNEKMPIPRIHLTPAEMRNGWNIARQNNRKVVVFQPFGSTARIENGEILDNTVRSLEMGATQQLINFLRNDGYDIAFFDDREWPATIDRNKFLPIRGVDCRVWASIIANSDYFLGVDSAGQHIARAFDKPGTVIIGGTTEVNTSYPDHFNIVKKNVEKRYMSYRLCDFDYWLSELENSDLMRYSPEEVQNICNMVGKDIKEKMNDKKIKK